MLQPTVLRCSQLASLYYPQLQLIPVFETLKQEVVDKRDTLCCECCSECLRSQLTAVGVNKG